jgi:hypothetical protein
MGRINRTSKRVTKYEALAQQRERLEYKTKGEGLYLYRNRSKDATLELPKPLPNGQKTVGPLGEFQGDSYYMQLVRTNLATLVREIISPAEEKAMNEQKLILDQPERVTARGTVEHVLVEPNNDGTPVTPKTKTKKEHSKKKETLLNEAPVDGVEILLG